MTDSCKTKQALAESLKRQLKTESFSSVSIARICDPCGISRKSFYYHFHDKYELVNWIFCREWLDGHPLPSAGELSSLCEYLYANREFYRKVLGVKGQNSFGEYLHERCRAAFGHADDFGATFYADAFLCAIKRWLCTRPTQSPQEFASQLLACIKNGRDS
ncbi:MAG: TetR/AcrR family transcriptional regulator C-terminal domain-containing protein [Clostridia bacterium]|nr:TetR/AcrR family transcriptional regulator C-terminal domain-containing protein [Clostridia bacterium]